MTPGQQRLKKRNKKMNVFLFLTVWGAIILTGTEEVSRDVSAVEGESVHLDVPGYKTLQYKNIEWICESQNIIILEYNNSEVIYYLDNEIVEFGRHNLSLVLKNGGVKDCRLYTAEISDAKGKRMKVVTYRLHIQTFVSKPAIETILSPSTGETSCYVTLKCSVTKGSGVSIHWTWNKWDSGETVTLNDSQIHLPLKTKDTQGGTFTCHAQNAISKETATVPNLKCQYRNSSPSQGFPVHLLKIILFSVGLVIMMSVVIGVHILVMIRNKKASVDSEPQTADCRSPRDNDYQ